MEPNHNYCLILAGGRGRRLWPCSREERPKQFLDFFGSGRTQLQQTWDRMASVVPPENILVNTSIDCLPLLQEQLPQLRRDRILVEPIPRNTAPSVAWANHRATRLDPKACLVVVPSDQMVTDEDAFRRDILEGLAYIANHDTFLCMGIKPTRPEPGYGYIQMDSHLEDNIFRVRTFTEKPDREFAQTFMESGEFLWNTGIFLANTAYMRSALSRFLPSVLGELDDTNYYASPAQEEAFMNDHFTSYPNMSMEAGVLDRLDDVCVMRGNFGWADLGTWHSIYEALPHSHDDNVVIDSDVIIEDSHHNVVKLPKGRLAVINGLDGYIVAESGNVLLICRKEDSSALVRKYVNEVAIRRGEKYI